MVMSMQAQLDRRAAVAALLRNRKDTLVVAGLGSPTYDLHSVGDHDGNFYLWGAMGGAALIGLGLAQAQPGKRVLALTGDGEQLMGLGGLATIGVARPRNLDIVVIDNQHFGETGMQASHTGRGVDLTSIAMACGFAATGTADDCRGGTSRGADRLPGRGAATLRHQGSGGKSAALAALARCRLYQEPVPCSSWICGGLSRVSHPAIACCLSSYSGVRP
ncbi:bll6808 [Bradyrhizobium diazoefficiens USDA 110]|uniref:Bll6808 protein n=1 Tax=Bradyrhizobium diazoefficiens (strain JCM 10833 / BCRC 13528 / IAM 13628 / NBRC 14792 / USDA 110) TaxID=224911 RepID=Q89F93_BRADU|nr:aldehyde dehydrogenase [Bradyrhizobium diazoefficiens]QBP25552.1 aldehyde dehydrogenase [Bradyrhizobium diazoefficiens]BAC52073.1 bll6808 [Bradyrhizobium diazoefficiens USDA 110]